MRAARILAGFATCMGGACGGAGQAEPVPVSLPAKAVEAAPSAAAPRATPDAPFREKAPAGGPAVTFVAPKIESFTLKNGAHVLLVERHDLPIVGVRLVSRRGAGDFAAARPGVLSFMGGMLSQGTKSKNALQISDEFDAMGAAFGAGVDWDSGWASVKVLAEKLDPALDLLADIVLQPSFPAEEIERQRTRRLSSLAQEKNSASAMASNSIAAAVYGRAHLYGHTLSGQEQDTKKITRDELVAAHKQMFVPSSCTIVAAGDVTRAALTEKLERAFGAWKGAPAARASAPKPGADVGPRLVVVNRTGAPQSQVYLAQSGAAWSTPDRIPLRVMNAILGGMFSSRMNLNLREKNAYSYGVSSRFSLRHGAGPFAAGGAVIGDKTAAAVRELLSEVDSIRTKEVSADELALAKENLRLSLPSRFESVSEVTSALADVAVYELPLDEYASLPARIDAVTAADVLKAAKAHLTPEHMKVIVAGDKASLVEPLAGLNLGPIEERDPYGDPVAAAASIAPAKTPAASAPAKPGVSPAPAPAKPAPPAGAVH